MIQRIILFGFMLNISAWSQTTVNPDISLIGRFETFTNNVKDSPEYGKLNFGTPGFELLVEGYLNPYARARATLAYEEEFDPEELYAEVLRGLPLNLQIKAGKYLVGFGKLNTFHPHTWPFIARPLSHQIFFGQEGFNDIGLDLSYMLPIEEMYSSITLGIYRGEAIANTLVSDEIQLTETRGNVPIWIGRWSNFVSLSDYKSLEVGLSASSGVYARRPVNESGDSTLAGENKPLNYLYTGLDIKYKFVPDIYTAFTIQAEGLINYRDVPRSGDPGIHMPKEMVTSITTVGLFISTDYTFNRQFSIGAKYDYTYGIIGDTPSFTTLANDDQNTTQGLYAWIGYYPVEESLVLRLELEHLMFDYENGISRRPETTATLQLIFSLGPHKAHPF